MTEQMRHLVAFRPMLISRASKRRLVEVAMKRPAEVEDAVIINKETQ